MKSIGSALIIVTPNPAVDATYHLPKVTWNAVNRAPQVHRRAGGKGVNVANVLAQLRHPSSVTGFLGGDLGQSFTRLLDSSGVEQQWVQVNGETRSTTTVVDSETTTLFNEPGPHVTSEDWSRLRAQVTRRCGSGDVVVLSGSCPPGTTVEDIRDFLTAVHAAGATTLVDTSGPLLAAAAEAGASFIKPNHDELAEATGISDVTGGARNLLARGAGAVAVSQGEKGLVMFHRSQGTTRAWRATPAEVVHGNPTGAGDSAVAAFALGLQQAASGENPATVWPTHVRHAVALSAAAVLTPVAGVVDLAAYERFMQRIQVEEIDVPV
jgi:1-phosphofructokinase family hexose kinase